MFSLGSLGIHHNFYSEQLGLLSIRFDAGSNSTHLNFSQPVLIGPFERKAVLYLVVG